MKLAKEALDVGLNTNALDPMLAFWQEQAGVPFSELLPVGGGVRQHRHAIGDSVLKINHNRDPLADAPPSGIARVEVFSDAVDDRLDLNDPDGNEVTLSPSGDATPNLRVHLAANDLDRSASFYGDTLELPEVGQHCFAVGRSQIQLHTATTPIATPVERTARGYRYMTVQVFDVVAEHAAVLAGGGGEGMAPVRLGDVAFISFVRDPDGNWLEISQRKSLTGSLD